MNHEEIRKSLSAYCSGDLPPAERAWVEEHLSSCRSCRAELAELKTTLQAIRTLRPVEPPTWLTSRIMSHIVEQPAVQKSWIQRLFSPPRVKLALEIMALLVISVSAYYIVREPESELINAVPQLQQTEMPPPKTPAATVPLAPHQPGSGKDNDRAESQPERRQELPAAAARRSEGEHPGAPPEHSASKSRTDSNTQAETRRTAPQAAPESSDGSAGRQKKSSRNVNAGASAPAATPELAAEKTAANSFKIRVSLIMGLDTLSAATVRQAVIRSGGTVIPIKPSLADRQFRAQIQAVKLEQLYDQLEKMARIVERPSVPDSAENVEIEILW
jgi:anti-sigma factor RsiW